ncbi:MAG: RIO1 family regulatory kinase/ATPase domain-containing protein [Planctomycetota bacterium]|jgi:RIO kinase 1
MSKPKQGSGLSAAGFTRGLLSAAEQAHLMETFGADGSIREVLGVIGDGKEATVYGCRAGPHTGVDLAVAKVYRAQRFRAFANARLYTDGQFINDGRTARAIRGKTRTGRLMQHHLWIEREWETLCRLYDAGADVPEPYTHSRDAILMEFVGDERGAAPLLRQTRLNEREARAVFEVVIRNVELFLACDRVHADLSPYNILYDGIRVCVIDFPQAVDTRTSPHAAELLRRDVDNVCRGFARWGVKRSSGEIASRLWSRYVRGRL